MSEPAATASRSAGPSAGVPARTILPLALAAFASSINIRSCDPLLPQIALSFSTSVGGAAAVITAFTIGYGLTQLAFGPVGDRLGKYRVVAVAALAAGIATALGAFMPTLETLIAARLVAGGFAAAAIPLAFAWIGDAVPFERRQGVLARFLSAQMMGIVLGQALGGIVGEFFGWPRMFLIVGALHSLAGIVMLYELRTNPDGQPPPATSRLGLSGLAAGVVGIAKRPWVRVLLAAVFVEAFAMYGAFAYIGADLHHRLGLGFSLVGLVLSVYGAGAVLYSLTARRLLARLGERGFVIAGGALMSTCFLALAAAPGLAVVPAIMLALGFGFYMMHNTLQTHATQMAPEARGLAVSIFAFALFCGQSAGVALAAPLVDRYGARPIYVAAAVILPAVAVWLRAQLTARHASGEAGVAGTDRR